MIEACQDCSKIVRCRDCKHGEEVPGTMFCDMLYEKPDWGLPEVYAGSEPCEHLEVAPDGFCAWGERRREQ